MAAGVCVTSFRLLMRRSTDFTHYTRRSTGLRIMPVATIGVNSWSFGGRQSYCTNKTEDLNSGNTTTTTSTDATSQTIKTASSSTSKAGKKTKSPVKDKKNTEIENENMFIINEFNLTEINLTQMKVAELKVLCRGYGLKTNGSKQKLIKELQNYIEQQKEKQIQTHNTTTKNNSLPLTLPTASTTSSTSSSSSSTLSISNDNMPSSTRSTSTLDAVTFDLSSTSLSKHKVVKSFEDINHSALHDILEIDNNGDVSVEYIHGLPHLTIPLPSRNEKCRFALKPVSHRVGDLIQMLKTEDRGIDRATILNNSGVRIASTCNIESLMDEPFWIHINDQKYKVVPPRRERIQTEDLNKLGDIKALVSQLYEALHVGEYHIEKEQELTIKLEDLKYQIAPLEREKVELSAQAERKANIMTWVGLGLMSVQFGILARLTWWEYSWDIMEPVTYFVTYGTAMAMYAYYCITKTEYNMPEVKDRQYLLALYKRAKKKNFDVNSYNQIKRQIAEIEYDLRRLRDPLNLQLPPHVDRSQQSPPLEPVSPTSALNNEISSATVKKSGFKIPFLDSKN